MSDPTPSMRAPAGVPPSGNGKYIVIALLLVGGIAALLAFKTCGSKPNTNATPPISTYDASPVSHDENMAPPPPPPEEPVVDSGPSGTRTAGGPYDACAVKTCSGTVTPELETWMGYRAKQAHRCYDQALAQDSELKGRVAIKVRVATNGSVCAADVTDNDMGTDTVARCVAATFRSSRSLPVPKGGCVDVKVPLSFVPGGGK